MIKSDVRISLWLGFVIASLCCISCQASTPTSPQRELVPVGTIGPLQAAPQLPSAVPGARLLFRSGFEAGVVLGPPTLRFGQWRQALSGADQGYDWASALPGSPVDFQYLVSSEDATTSDELKRFVETRLDTLAGRDGQPTQALFQALRSKGTLGSTQNDLILFNMQHPEQGYLRYWMKLQPDLLDLMTQAGDWRVILEWKETPEVVPPSVGIDFQYRWLVTLSRAKPTKDAPVDGIVWKVEGDVVAPNQAALGTPWTDDWTIWNRQLPVPLGRWFLFEVYWRLDPGKNGRVLVKADGAVVADHRDRTQLDASRGKLYPFINYMAGDPLTRGEAYQWVDDVELWSELPYAEEPLRTP